MADVVLTLLDIMKINNGDATAGLIDEAAQSHPEWGIIPARTIRGTQFKTLVRTALPAGAFRAANEGAARQKANYENRLVECFIFDASWDHDKAVADAAEDGPAAANALVASDHAEGAVVGVCSQVFYGPTHSGMPGAAKGFQGLIDFVDATMVVDAGGTTATTGSSVWALRLGPKDCTFIMGADGNIDDADGDVQVVQLADTAGNKYWAYAQAVMGWIGLQLGSIDSVGRISKITADSGKTLTDNMLDDLWSKFPAGKKPHVMFMSDRSLKQLKQSRTATNATGTPAPWPTEYLPGVPIVPTESIIDIEALTW